MNKVNDIRADLSLVHPYTAYLCKRLCEECNKKGIYLIITEGFRTVDRQNELYAQGRTKEGNIVTQVSGNSMGSQHMWGLAFDIAINDKKLLYDNFTMKKVGQIADGIDGLGWGGNWKMVDMPHFYYDIYGSTTTVVKSKFVNLKNFQKTWTRTCKKKSGLYIWNKKRWSTQTTKDDIKRGKIPYKAKVNICYDKDNGWSFIEYGGIYGWVMTKHLA